jgi:uncharacterized protein
MAITSFSFKIASRCNLNCSYCYVYNKGDSTWRARPPIMSDRVFTSALERIREYCRAHGRNAATIVFHGGEPTLVGAEKLRKWCEMAWTQLAGINVAFTIQTNGTLIDEEWAKLFSDFNFNVGLSVDGPAEIHDLFRVDHLGRGSFDRVSEAASMLSAFNVQFGILSVVQFGADPLSCHRALVKLGSRSIGYMLPHFTHDTVGPIHERFGRTPCADFLLPILDYWWENQIPEMRIREFWNIGRLIMGGRSRSDTIGNDPFGYLFVESDGDIEGLDILRICGDESYRTGLNVLRNGFDEIANISPMHAQLLSGSFPKPSACASCPERETCAGGYLPHRHSKSRGFDNPSVWCADLLLLFNRMRELLGISPVETAQLRRDLVQSSGAVTI